MNQYRFFDKFGNSYFFTVPKGIDGQSAEDYAENLEANLQSLLDRAKSGDHYKAPPVRRVFIPKGDGKSLRPLGIPTVSSNCVPAQK